MTMFQTKSLFHLAAAALLALPMAASAGEITLTSHDQSVRLTGDFLGFHQDRYVINYKGRELSVPLLLMTCEGEDCITFEPVAETTQTTQDNG